VAGWRLVQGVLRSRVLERTIPQKKDFDDRAIRLQSLIEYVLAQTREVQTLIVVSIVL
jgi:hypothetical protein